MVMKAKRMFPKMGGWEGKIPEDRSGWPTLRTLSRAGHSRVCPGLCLRVLSVFISSPSGHFTLERRTFKMFYFFTRIVVKLVLTLKIFNRFCRYYMCPWLYVYVLE